MNDTSSAAPLDCRFLLGGLAGAAGISALAAMAKAGPLNPPGGAVASSGKTLTEVEPRTAVNSANTPGDSGAVYRITQPGSYYLTANLALTTNQIGIAIGASDVALDLNGFTISGDASSYQGVAVTDPFVNICIRNGSIRNLQSGIRADTAGYARIENLSVIGCILAGIVTGDNALVANCLSIDNGTGVRGGGGGSALADGIAVGMGSCVRSCAARGSGRFGILHAGRGLVTDCSVSGSLSTGIYATERTLVRGCEVDSCSVGISANTLSRVESCRVSACTQYGINASIGRSVKIIGNDVAEVGSAFGHAAIRIASQATGCTVEGNRLENNYRHIEVVGSAHLIIRNTMAYTGPGGAMTIPGGNAFGPLVVVGGVGNISGTALSDHPQANFSY